MSNDISSWPASAIQMRSVGDIAPHPKNSRKHSETQIKQVMKSMQEWGWTIPILVDESDVVIAGHARLLAAQRLGFDTVPCLTAKGWSESKKRAYLIADNKLTENGEWDLSVLKDEIISLTEDGFDTGLLGFTAFEIEKFNALIIEGEDPPIPESVPPKTHLGEVWNLGEHRLVVADCTQPETWKLGGLESATLLITDPPWNVAIGGDSNPKCRQREGLINDNLNERQFTDAIREFVSTAMPFISGDWYVCMAGERFSMLDTLLRSNDMHWSATITWVKDQFVLGKSKYHSRSEFFWYGWKDKSSFVAGRQEDDVWEIPRPRISEEHPTMKPVALYERAMRNSSSQGDWVVDCFAGSGTVFLAAEKLQRKALGIELSPQFADVCIARWETLTNRKAVLQRKTV